MAVGAATHMRSMQAGFAGHGAMLAVELAQLGLTGPREIFEGRYGMFRTYIRGEPDWSWNCSAASLANGFLYSISTASRSGPPVVIPRRPNAAIQSLRAEFRPVARRHRIDHGGRGNRWRSPAVRAPGTETCRPPLAIAAKHSIPFTAAIMAVHGNVTLQDYTEAGLQDPAVLAMADRVFYRPTPDVAAVRGDGPTTSAPSVEIRTRDGRTLTRTPDGVPGDPRNPPSQEQLEREVRRLSEVRRQADFRRRRRATCRGNPQS